MAIKHQVPGAVLIKVGVGTAGALVDLGYSVNGVDIQEKEFIEPVKSDRYGGSGGADVDVQILGLGADISMELSDFDPEVMIRLQSRMPLNTDFNADQGKVPTPGTLMFQSGGIFRLLLQGVLDTAALAATPGIEDTLMTPRNYPFCRVSNVIGYQVGSPYCRPTLRVEAYQGLKNSDVIVWDRDAS